MVSGNKRLMKVGTHVGVAIWAVQEWADAIPAAGGGERESGA